MTLKSLLFLFVSSIFISACSSPVTWDVRYDNVTFDAINRKTEISAIDSLTQQKISDLRNAILDLGPNIDKTEANLVAREAVLFPRHLANEYKMIGPPNSHNVLVNTGYRTKGLCYHFARDMTDHIVKGRTFNTLTLQRAVSFQGKHFEHNVLTVAAKGKGIRDAIILDAWRDSTDLYFVKTGDDPFYTWSKYTPRTYTAPSSTSAN